MSDYAFYPAWNTALASLHNLENHLGSRNRITVSGELKPVTIRSTLIDPFPVRNNDQAGGESGDGFVNQDWILTLALYGYKYLVDTYFASETVAQAAWTVNTRRHTLAAFQRFNCWAILPSAANGDVVPLREDTFNGVFRVRLRLRDLIAI
jgi:hypothetical protein